LLALGEQLLTPQFDSSSDSVGFRVFTALTPCGGLFQHLCLGRRDPRSSPHRSCARDAGETVRDGGQRREDHGSATLELLAALHRAPRAAFWRAFEAMGGEQKSCPHDEAPLALMRANPWARVTEIIRMNGGPPIRLCRRSSGSKKPGSSSTPGGANGPWSILICSRPRRRNQRSGSSRCQASESRATRPTVESATR
jgi:hypothetical protein